MFHAIINKAVGQFLIVFLFFCSVFSGAQTKGTLIEKSLDIKIPFTITQFSTKDGLPQSRVIDIVPKANGNLIILTANGIVEYNGSEFISFIKSDSYKSLYYSKLIWHEKTKQLFCLSGAGLMAIFPEFRSLYGLMAPCIFRDTLYCLNEQGEMFSADLAGLKFVKRASTGVKKAKCLYIDSVSCVIGSAKGVYTYDFALRQSQKRYVGDFTELKRNPYNGTVYAVAEKEVIQLKGQVINSVLDLRKEIDPLLIHTICFFGEEDYFVTTTQGLFEITKDYTDRYTKLSALPSAFLQALYYDVNENCLFIGTGEKGLLKLQFKNCYTFTTKQGFTESASISSIIRTKSGKTNVINYKGELYQIKIDTLLKLTDLKVPCASMAEIDGLVYVGTWYNGVLILQDNKVVDSIPYPSQLPDHSVHGVYKDSRGIIWIGTSKGISNGRTPSDIRPYLSKEIKGKIICFYELKNKNICIGGQDGAYILDTKSRIIKHLGIKDGLLGKEVRSFYEDDEGKLWIGTYDGGLFCYDKTKLTSINSLKNSTLDRDVFCLAKDQFGYLYMTSNHGLWRIEEKKLTAFYKGEIDYLIPFYYGEENGIINTEFDGGFQNNYLRSPMNHFYFPSIEGLVIVDPEMTSFRKLLPQINKMYVNDTLHDLNKKVLNDKTFSIAFHFSCLSYLNKYNIYFQYKLESEKETEWSSLQKNTSVAFKMLPAGNYTFTLRALDAFNDVNPTQVSYSFKIQPVYYETQWFKLLMFFLLILITSIIIRLRITRFRRQLEEKERVRRQLAEFELKATHAQMNPHFIFNSLNSIKYYLSINDQKNADNYIDHFSSLLRSFLENGSKDFIELKEEIGILTSYLELEKQRMNPPFTYLIEASNDLNHLLIPTHMIQPFVENAIKHGINHSEKKCHLTIQFYKEGSYLICVIDDDGIGRERSKVINAGRLDHRSKGMEMVLEKIRIVKEVYKLEIFLNIEDKVDDENNSNGTRVIIKIPINTNENSHS